MFNAEKVLGGLLHSTLYYGLRAPKKTRRGKRGITGLAGSLLTGRKTRLGMGLLGLAFAAYEHFSQQGQGGSPSRIPTSLPPLPERDSHRTVSAGPGGETAQKQPSRADTLLLIRAMIAAAHADHRVDEKERATILKRIEQTGLDDEERDFLMREFENPMGVQEIVKQVSSAEMAEQVYAASLLAMELDSETEGHYLRILAMALNLNQAAVARWHDMFGIRKL